MADNYPNFMCFGRDIGNCHNENLCQDFKACQEAYDKSWLDLFDERSANDGAD